MLSMFYLILAAIFGCVALLWLCIWLRVDSDKLRNKHYKELLLVLGSGGHTGEMCELIRNFDFHKVAKVQIALGQTDASSETYFRKFIFDNFTDSEEILDKTSFFYVIRTNEVKQSKISAVFSTLGSLWSIFQLITSQCLNCTDMVANGPGICVPFFLVYFLLKKARLSRVKLIFVESWCRVNTISLTGKIVRYMSDNFVVHWQQQQKLIKPAKWYGKII